MSPTTRASSKRAPPAIVPSDPPAQPRRKRQKRGISVNVEALSIPAPQAETSNTMQTTLNKNKNAHLKGRKRFIADLEDMKAASRLEGFMIHGLHVHRLRPGDDEGTIEFTVLQGGQHFIDINLLVSDTSEYPENHIFYACSPDNDVKPAVLDVIQDLTNQRARILQDTIRRLLFDLARTNDPFAQDPLIQDEEQDVDEDENMTDYDEDLDFAFGPSLSKSTYFDADKLQRDFIEAVADEYRPGLIRFGTDDFALSVSLPIVFLAERVSPRVLMAWDRRLLARTQHFTLIISGLRGTYPILRPDGTYEDCAVHRGVSLSFKVGLTQRYKPSKEHTADLVRNFGLVVREEELCSKRKADKATEEQAPTIVLDEFGDPIDNNEFEPAISEEEAEPENDSGRFERFSLSASLESLLENRFMRVVQLRIKFKLGWAGAEALLAEVESSQKAADNIFPGLKQSLRAVDNREQALAESYMLPPDPMMDRDECTPLNLAQLAFTYLLRRLMLCTRFCLVCHNTLQAEYEVIKPYVCDSKLCAYQYYNLNRGPSVEYEICHNTETVDLLVSLAYSAAIEGALAEPLPVGLGLRVPLPDTVAAVPQTFYLHRTAQPAPVAFRGICGEDGLIDFDALDVGRMRAAIACLIDSLPAISDMKKHLEKKVGRGETKPKLSSMDPAILPAAWTVLRWCIGSCTAHLEELKQPEDMVQNIGSSWRQFKFSVGAPDAEATFNAAVLDAQKSNENCIKYPSLFAFHGSPLRNWHSIIRHGLWYKTVSNGRSHGNGVYLAKEGSISMGSYATPGTPWKNSIINPSSCVALTEIINLPNQFVCQNPFFVVAQTKWIICRYLLVNSGGQKTASYGHNAAPAEASSLKKPDVPYVALDPTHPPTLGHHRIAIPQPSHKLDKLMVARNAEYVDECNDEEDVWVFSPQIVGSQQAVVEAKTDKSPGPVQRAGDDWVHDADWVNETVEHLMPPPVEATPTATMALQKELKAMLREQERATSLRELGWYMPPGFIGDNLYQWIVEVHSFENDLPIAQDLKKKKINSLVFEIRFPPTFPHSPPFFRIIKPRLLPFIQGGGGHVTGGGSMCMDLLTSDGWLPSYSISAVLLQIKLAISNLDPRPARLSQGQWNNPYGIQEALQGFKRAAAAHGWKVPEGTEALLR